MIIAVLYTDPQSRDAEYCLLFFSLLHMYLSIQDWDRRIRMTTSYAQQLGVADHVKTYFMLCTT